MYHPPLLSLSDCLVILHHNASRSVHFPFLFSHPPSCVFLPTEHISQCQHNKLSKQLSGTWRSNVLTFPHLVCLNLEQACQYLPRCSCLFTAFLKHRLALWLWKHACCRLATCIQCLFRAKKNTRIKQKHATVKTCEYVQACVCVAYCSTKWLNLVVIHGNYTGTQQFAFPGRKL